MFRLRYHPEPVEGLTLSTGHSPKINRVEVLKCWSEHYGKSVRGWFSTVNRNHPNLRDLLTGKITSLTFKDRTYNFSWDSKGRLAAVS